MKKSDHILGINCSGFHSSACLMREDRILYAICEERISRIKRDRSFPHQAIDYCCKAAGIDFNQVSDVFIGWHPRFYIQQSDSTLTEAFKSRGKLSYLALNELATKIKGEITDVLHTVMHEQGELRIHFVDHHKAHAAGGFFLSGFDHAAFLVLDGFGENTAGLAGTMSVNEFTTIQKHRTPHSLGSFYSTFTDFLGFTPNNDEWKVMALASLGDPTQYYQKVRSLVTVSDLNLELDLSYFEHFLFFTPNYYSQKFIEAFGPPRGKDDELEQRHYDVVAAAQKVTEETIFAILQNLHKRTGEKNLIVGGGTFMNSVCNGKIVENTPFENLFIGGSPDDSGVCLGSALYGAHFTTKQLKCPYFLGHNYFGRLYPTDEIRSYLTSRKLKFTEVDNPALEAARLLRQKKIVAWFQGASEFGQRALGNRSILADPTLPEAKDLVNQSIKYRETFRPFAPSVIRERQNDYFEIHGNQDSLYMEKVFSTKKEWRKKLPGVVHFDGSGRLHSVDRGVNPSFHKLLQEFEKLSGVPIVLNTSFNINHMPLVESPQDAIHCFSVCGLDVLILENLLLSK